MISAGIDIGAQNIKVVIVKDNKEVLVRHSGLKGLDWKVTLDEVLEGALKKGGLSREDLKSITVGGASTVTKEVPYATDAVTEVTATARGIAFLLPTVKTVIDVGAENARAIKCDGGGKVMDFVTNDRCAAGAGSFVEAMSRALETTLSEFAQSSLKSTQSIPMNAQCVVFAESEVVSLIHAKTPHADIAFAVHNAITERIASLAQRVGIEREVALIGGVAYNVGFVACMKKQLGIDILIPQDPEYVTALGAALIHN
ncbi:MAG: CoA activase [Chloroflexi bacterium]|nr:CoA activase [Chloroflexota bacterium]